ncbi:MAG: ExeM/NucH family extracellular endonuclease [Cellvibrionaceae bacterium]|nr:ExeM/NucH family extracellular endonuclease [Cellvibrionaceae bacterium]
MLTACCAASSASAEVFISEIHYDNAGTDEGEAIEISADLNTSLSGWQLVLYNGANSESYNTINLSGFAQASESCGSAGGTLVINLPSNGIQNGGSAADGLALVDASGEVVEFLSYEGVLVASDGPASGLTSMDIGVSEDSSTPPGESLQLVDGTWQAPNLSTFGICTTPVSGGGSEPTAIPTTLPTPEPTPAPPAASDIFISEIHYDNIGSDSGEAIELSGPADSDLSGWQIVLYNGNDRSSYGSIILGGSLQTAADCDAAYAVFNRSGLQNGGSTPDGLALVDASGAVVEFLSYEGSFVANGGPADGITSVDIGVFESSATPLGYSLQKISGQWQAPAPANFGTCSTEPVGPPAGEVVKIHEVQGEGSQVALNGVVTVEAIVTASYQGENQLRGFFIQEEDRDTDDDPRSSEAILVDCGAACPTAVAPGDQVRVTGLAQEFSGMSGISAGLAADIAIVSRNNPLPSISTVNLPVPVDAADLGAAQAQIDAYFEPFEGMRVAIPETLTVDEHFELGRYGQLVLSSGDRPRQFTDQQPPSEAGYIAQQIHLRARRIILDDDSSRQNVALISDAAVFHPQPGLSTDNFLRSGDSITGVSGVLHFFESEWRVRPVAEENYQFTRSNSRSAAPTDVGGSLKVASFNVLNYFTTLDEPGVRCGPQQNLDCRGANSSQELYRQTQKITAAICAMNADILGLMELENPAPGAEQTPLDSLVAAVNAECGDTAYAAVNSGSIGGDAITVGFMYNTHTVGLAGPPAILDSKAFTDPADSGTDKNRPALAQSFIELSKNARLTIAVNHLKSKGSSCGAGDDDRSSGQGNCNLTRSLAAQVLAEWLDTGPTGVDSDYVLVIGDLNAYRFEDPIQRLEQAGYIDLVNLFGGDSAYGYLFDGQLGYLDHALANQALFPYVSGVTDWHINADEINLLDYNDTVLDANEASFEAKPSATELFAPDPYRSSDHDPLVIGIELPSDLQISDLAAAFNAGYAAGEIRGAGFGPIRLILALVFIRELGAAEWYYSKGKLAQACKQLDLTIALSDGQDHPMDYIVGPGVANFNQLIKQVRSNLLCD